MKKLILLFTAISFSLTFQNANAEKTDWKVLHDFHAIMSKSFHPTEEGNFKPLKENASALAKSAKTWAASKVPDGFDKELTPKILAKLVAKCDAIEKSVNEKASDDVLKVQITEAHEIFHQIVEKCQKPEEGSKEKGHEGHDHK